MVKTIGPVFQSYAPGLGLLDLAVGVAGAVILYFVVQSKIKKARKFRRDMEYGSARWGTEADIKPFVDPKFENNVILTGTEFLTMNTRPKIPANARNLNACVIGSSGSGKTRFWLTPQLLQAHSSYVVVDPKGGVDALAEAGVHPHSAVPSCRGRGRRDGRADRQNVTAEEKRFPSQWPKSFIRSSNELYGLLCCQ